MKKSFAFQSLLFVFVPSSPSQNLRHFLIQRIAFPLPKQRFGPNPIFVSVVLGEEKLCLELKSAFNSGMDWQSAEIVF